MRFWELTSFVTARKNLLVCPRGSLLKDGMWIQSFSSSKKASSGRLSARSLDWTSRIERCLWWKKLRVNNQTIFVSKQTDFVATPGLCIVVPCPPYVVSAGLFVRLPSVGLNDWDLEHRVVVRYVFIGWWAQGCLLSALAIRAFVHGLLMGVDSSSGKPVVATEPSSWVAKVRFPSCNQHTIQIWYCSIRLTDGISLEMGCGGMGLSFIPHMVDNTCVCSITKYSVVRTYQSMSKIASFASLGHLACAGSHRITDIESTKRVNGIWEYKQKWQGWVCGPTPMYVVLLYQR